MQLLFFSLFQSQKHVISFKLNVLQLIPTISNSNPIHLFIEHDPKRFCNINSVKLFKNQFSCVLAMHVTGTSLFYLLTLTSNFTYTYCCYPNRKCFENKGLLFYFEHFQQSDRMVCCHPDQVITGKNIERWPFDKSKPDKSKCCLERKFTMEKCHFHPGVTIKSVLEGGLSNLESTTELELIRVRPLNQTLISGLSNIATLILTDLAIESFDFLQSLMNLRKITVNNVKVRKWFQLNLHQNLRSLTILDTNLTITDIKKLLQNRSQLNFVRMISYQTFPC